MVEALGCTLYLFRLIKTEGYDGEMTYMRSTLTNCKLGQGPKGWSVDVAGSVRSASATLYWNYGHSGENPELDPLFREGDIIATRPALRRVKDDRFILSDAMYEVGDRQAEVPYDVEYTIQAIQKHTFKGKLHHCEVILV